MLLVLGVSFHHFSWLLAAIGLCLMAAEGQRQGFYFFTINANGQGEQGPNNDAFVLGQLRLSTPWLLMLQIKTAQGWYWLYLWQDSVSEDNWCRLRRITRSFRVEHEQPTEG